MSVREAARRAGVSPGAPFRHFESRDALLAAVAEEAQAFQVEIDKALAKSRTIRCTAEAVLDLFISGIARPSGHS